MHNTSAHKTSSLYEEYKPVDRGSKQVSSFAQEMENSSYFRAYETSKTGLIRMLINISSSSEIDVIRKINDKMQNKSFRVCNTSE